ncbi:Ulp1 protease family, C-terminal catalytic domain-containing protein [Carex littledalei]|uniref:Ulp1 protease family, C-terminal catalytic domain-containing protein n=1 Tax=Carex littledalei TaxID=544730 RepID=A0A833V9G6_9POAL|nr:Ulp1 protease family, C-terminal catalytic domain-containing protein [Carex littledalei]
MVEIHSLNSSNQEEQAISEGATPEGAQIGVVPTISTETTDIVGVVPTISTSTTENVGLKQPMENIQEEANPPNPSQMMETPQNVADDEEKPLSLKRPRGGQLGRKKGDRINKPRTSDSCIKNRCIVESAMFFFHSQVMPRLHRDHIKVLARTPFMYLFAFPNRTQANNPLLHSILLKWDNDKGGFLLSNKLLMFTPDEVALVMGLGFEGEVVVYKRETLTFSALRRKFFEKRNEKITRKELEDTIIAALGNKKGTAEEIGGLLVMYIFTTILFPQNSGNVPIHLFPYVENIDRLRKYNWAETAWFFEHVEVPKVRIFRGHIPRFYNWKLHIGWRRDSFSRKLDLVRNTDIKPGSLDWSPSEALFKTEGLVFNFYSTCLARTDSLRKTHNLHLYKLVMEMAPIYNLFKFRVCNELLGCAASHMIEDLKYVEEESTELPKLSPATEQKMIAEVSHEEWKYQIKKKSRSKNVSPPGEQHAKGECKKSPGKGKQKGKAAKVEEKKGAHKPSSSIGVVTRSCAKLLEETPSSPLNKRVLYSVTPTPSVGKDAPVKRRKKEGNKIGDVEGKKENPEEGTDKITPEDVGVETFSESEETLEPQLTQNESVLQYGEIGTQYGGTLSDGGLDASDVVAQVLNDLKKKKHGEQGEENKVEPGGDNQCDQQKEGEENQGEKGGDKQFVEQKGVEKEVGVKAGGGDGEGKGEQGDQGGDGEGKGEQGEKVVDVKKGVHGSVAGNKETVIRLGDEHPTFSLGLTPPPPEIKKVSKELPIIPIKTTKLYSRAKILMSKKAGLRQAMKQDSQIIEISSQEQEKPAVKKGAMNKRVPMRRIQPKRNYVDKEPFVGEPFIHDDLKESMTFKNWVQTCLFQYDITEIEGVPFRYFEDHKDWDFCNDSLFIDPDIPELTQKQPLAKKSWEYEYRDMVSDTVSNVLDAWVNKYFNNILRESDYPFQNKAADLFMLPDHFRDILFSGNQIGPEVVEIAAFLLQRDTPVKNNEEWFYVIAKTLDMGHTNSFMKLFLAQPHLFSEQFERAKWLFVPLYARGHWILGAVDLKHKVIHLYNSLKDEEENMYWFSPHINTMHWVKYFLSWRLGDEEWMKVEYTWMGCPHQEGSNDCAIFIIRIMDCLSRNVAFDFDQAMIRKERLLLAFRILVDDRNDLQFSPNM